MRETSNSEIKEPRTGGSGLLQHMESATEAKRRVHAAVAAGHWVAPSNVENAKRMRVLKRGKSTLIWRTQKSGALLMAF